MLPTKGQWPWDIADISFAGWVPTILGHLSYSMVGIENRWSHQRSFNELDTTTGRRFVATHQRRTAQDFPIWDWLLRLLRPAAAQHYILIGETGSATIPFVEEKKELRLVEDTQGVLTGKIFVLPWQIELEKRWDVENLIRTLSELTDNKVCKLTEICEKVTAELIKAGTKEILVHEFEYALFRTGEVRIWSSVEQALGAPHDKSSLTADQRVILERLPRQVYYFIKDTAHNHYHHEPSSDQILPLVRTESVCSIADIGVHAENEIKWRREVLWGLARVLARYRRKGSILQLKRAQGILAYADSFQATVGRTSRGLLVNDKPKYDDDLTTYDFAHAKQSVSASEGLRTWQNAGNLQIIVGLLAIVFSAASFWGTAVRLSDAACSGGAYAALKLNCEGHFSHRAVHTAIWISRHPLVFVGSLMIPLTFAYSIWVKDIRDFDWARKPSHFLWALSQAIGASVAKKSGNSYLGFGVAVGLVVATILLASYVIYWSVQMMQVP